jgi:hypothetical protein
MVEDRPEESESAADSGRARRPPPTIDLKATEVSGETGNVGADAQPEPIRETPSAAISPWVIAPVSGAVAAALVIGVAWVLGWPAPAPPGAAQNTAQVDTAQVNSAQVNSAPVNAAVVDDLAARVAAIESKTSQPATSQPAASAPDPAAAVQVEALEKSLAALRGEVSSLRAQSEKLAADANEAKSAPGESSAPPDLSAVNERIAAIERAIRAQSAETAQDGAKPAAVTDDVPLRRVVVASLLDISARHGDPYAAMLAAAKSLAPDPGALAPLDGFASSGVPNPASLSRELLTLVPKLSPPAPENSTTGSRLVERLQAGAARLVRIERADAVGTDRGAVVARVTAAALRNDVNEARRELKTLEPADRVAAQAWIDKADARDAALAASRQFATDAMTALAKPAQ